MADAVTTQTIFDGDRKAIMKFTNVSDGTGESAVTKVDVSALRPSSFGRPCDGVTIKCVYYTIGGMSVSVLWDADTDTPALILGPGQSTFDFSDFQIPNNSGAGSTGDILFTTNGADAGDTYTIVLEMIKSYED